MFKNLFYTGIVCSPGAILVAVCLLPGCSAEVHVSSSSAPIPQASHDEMHVGYPDGFLRETCLNGSVYYVTPNGSIAPKFESGSRYPEVCQGE